MLPTTSGGASFATAVANEAALQRLVGDIAAALEPGDFITLSGDLGTGKTTFARALIRHLASDPSMAVPSPTFNLIQTYDLPTFPVVHADLYRLDGSGELAELGLDDLPKDAVVLVEWPDRAAGLLPVDRLDVAFALSPELDIEHRDIRVTGYGSFAPRAERIDLIRKFLNDSGYAEVQRRRIQGDASTRSYERLRLGNKVTILMNAPRRPDGPPVRDGKPYSAIAHLAEDVKPFAAMASGLRQIGLSAPQIKEADLETGLLIIEDLGSEAVVAGNPPAPIDERYAAAVDVLNAIHAEPRPDVLPVAPQVQYQLPRYDISALLIELELLLDWYMPRLGIIVSPATRGAFIELWRDALQGVIDSYPSWVLRDYHSPNLLWLPQRAGIKRVGLLDFQDAMIGPAAYDLASLLQDARVDVPEIMEVTLLGRYVRARTAAEAGFDPSGFIKTYATMAAQRASKILGIFARLEARDRKPQYLRHIPRVWAYLQRALAHPALKQLNAWYGIHVTELRP